MSEIFGCYIKKQKFGSGGYGQIYLAEKIGEKEKEGKKNLYVLKIPQDDKMDILDKYSFNNEIDILDKLSKLSGNKYTPKLYESKKFNLGNENMENEIKVPSKEENNKDPYYVIDYFSKGNLFFYFKNNVLPEKIAKFLFKNIALGVQFLHKNNICHLDLKPENIILDKTFRPIIIDYGFSQKYMDEYEDPLILKGNMGTDEYKCPEMWEKEKFYGHKADIFSLGVILLNLAAGCFGFDSSQSTDEYYKLIINRDYSSYWKKIGLTGLSDELKELYLEMIHDDPHKRPTIDEVLNDDWLKEIKELSEEEEKEIRNELLKIYQKVRTYNENIFDFKIKKNNFTTRSINTDNELFFKEIDLKPKNITSNREYINLSIIINGFLDEIDFMNTLVEKINKKFLDNCLIEPRKGCLKFFVIFEDSEIDEKKLGNCSMEIELFKYEGENKYLLEFIRTKGEIKDYYEHFLIINDIISKNINNN